MHVLLIFSRKFTVGTALSLDAFALVPLEQFCVSFCLFENFQIRVVIGFHLFGFCFIFKLMQYIQLN